MDRTLIAVTILTLTAYLVFGLTRPQTAIGGFEEAAKTLWQATPWIVISILAAGLLSQLMDPALVAQYLSRDAGAKAVIIGALLGLCGTGSRWAVYPLGAGLLAANASYGAVFAFATTWQLVSLPRLPSEIPFFGAEFTMIRAVMSVAVAIIGGMLINIFHSP